MNATNRGTWSKGWFTLDPAKLTWFQLSVADIAADDWYEVKK